MTPTPHRSFWLQEVLAQENTNGNIRKCPPLDGTHDCDIAIIGGGYVGLWTAIQAKKLDPQIRISIFEKDICGGGASGRNGGFVLSWWPKISSLIAELGQKNALEVVQDSVTAVQEIEKFCQQNNIDCEFRWSPWIWAATSDAQRGAWDGVVETTKKLGLDIFKPLSPDELARRTGSDRHLEGVIDHTSAIVHPAKLVRGMRRVALDMGINIFENDGIENFTRTSPLDLKTSSGHQVQCKKLIICNNAWAAGIPELARSIVPISSDMIMTAPARPDLEKIGWTGGECITDSQMMVDYYHVTKDHRISFGKGGWGIAYKDQMGPDFDQNSDRAKKVEADFRRTYPSLNHIEVTHHWSGPIDRTPSSLPRLGRFTKNHDILYAVGWSGNGVGPSWVGGNVMANLVLEKNSRWANYPLIGSGKEKFPPEPIRYIGAHVVRTAVEVKEAAEIENLSPPWWSVALSQLAPKGLEDKE